MARTTPSPARHWGPERGLHTQAALRRHLLLQQAQRDREGPRRGGGEAGQVRGGGAGCQGALHRALLPQQAATGRGEGGNQVEEGLKES